MKKIISIILFGSVIGIGANIKIIEESKKGVIVQNEYGTMCIPCDKLPHDLRIKYDKEYKKQIQDQNKQEKQDKLRYELCFLLDQLLEFKDSSIFHFYGFGVNGPYGKWLIDIQNKYNQSKSITAGDIMQLGFEYCNKKGQETNYTKLILPKIQKNLRYKKYLTSHDREKRKEKIRLDVCILMERFLIFNPDFIYNEYAEQYSNNYQIFVKDVEKFYNETYSKNALDLFELSIKHRYYQQHKEAKNNIIENLKKNIHYDEYIKKQKEKRPMKIKGFKKIYNVKPY